MSCEGGTSPCDDPLARDALDRHFPLVERALTGVAKWPRAAARYLTPEVSSISSRFRASV